MLVEVWDVPDKGRVVTANTPNPEEEKAKLNRSGSKAQKKNRADSPTGLNSSKANVGKGPKVQTTLDASTVNIYKNCQGVIFMVDPRQKESFKYMKAVVKKVPEDLDVLIVVNFRDCPQKERHVTEERVEQYLRTTDGRLGVILSVRLPVYDLPPPTPSSFFLLFTRLHP